MATGPFGRRFIQTEDAEARPFPYVGPLPTLEPSVRVPCQCRRHGSASAATAEFLDQEIHQQAVVPAGAVGVALVPAHDSDGLEAHGGVATDRRLVVCGWVDHQAMVAPVAHQVPGQGRHGVAADATPVHRRVHEDVDEACR